MYLYLSFSNLSTNTFDSLRRFYITASKWQLRHDAIEQLRSFIESGGLEQASSDIVLSISSILLVVREQTRGFRETNVNIMKAILNLCVAICEFNESKENLLPIWAMKDVASMCVQKISDRKLLSACQQLLSAAAVVSLPFSVLQSAFVELKNVKSPVAHEEFLKWFQSFCNEFGAPSIGRAISDLIPYLLEVSVVTRWSGCVYQFAEAHDVSFCFAGTRVTKRESKARNYFMFRNSAYSNWSSIESVSVVSCETTASQRPATKMFRRESIRSLSVFNKVD
jgi:hypothetical protein